MCRLLARIVASTATLVVRGGVPVMSLRLLDVTDEQTNSTPADCRRPE